MRIVYSCVQVCPYQPQHSSDGFYHALDRGTCNSKTRTVHDARCELCTNNITHRHNTNNEDITPCSGHQPQNIRPTGSALTEVQVQVVDLSITESTWVFLELLDINFMLSIQFLHWQSIHSCLYYDTTCWFQAKKKTKQNSQKVKVYLKPFQLSSHRIQYHNVMLSIGYK